MAVAKTRQDFEAEIIKKAWENDKFRQELLDNPKAVLSKMYDITLPENLTLEIHVESPTTMHLILPAKPGSDKGDELSDSDLDAVAGGFFRVQNPDGSWSKVGY